MATNFDHRGDAGLTIEYENPSTVAIASGTIVDLGTMVGVALVDIDGADSGSVGLIGIVDPAPAPTDEAWAVGDVLYWDGTDFTTTATLGSPAGRALAVKATAGTTGRVWIAPGAGA